MCHSTAVTRPSSAISEDCVSAHTRSEHSSLGYNFHVMLVRIRSKDGNFRFELESNADISALVNKILETTSDADPATLAISNQPRGNETLVSTLKGRSLPSLGLSHGDLVFVSYNSQPASSFSIATTTAHTAEQIGPSTRLWETVEEEPIDKFWRSKDGKIPRGRDARLCKHGPNGMCDYCMPLEPYEQSYHTEHNIKHLSYHAYLKKLTPKNYSSSFVPPLNPLSYKVKVPCPSGHPNWPAGICTACQPSAITLQPQPFRMVDHLEIASMDVINRFLQAWRMTGLQRFGWLIGRYEPYPEVPMGVKAVVEAIHEPPQEGELDGLSLGLPWEDEPGIRELAQSSSTPLTIVGYIFTDLEPQPEDKTKTVYKRHPQSFYLSSLEAIFAATLQNTSPVPSRSSETGYFGSRLVTAVLTGTEDGQVDVSAYQVSEQAVAMVDADMIEASVEPGIVRVKEDDRSEDSARYVPDVFFRYKNEYGLEVKKTAKPSFPVEYLLVNVSHGFPQNPSPIFRSTKFSIENRLGLESQSVENVIKDLTRFNAPEIGPGSNNLQKRFELAEWLSDWHLISFLGTTQLISPNDMKTLIRTATSPALLEDVNVLNELLNTDGWQTLMTFTREMAPPPRLDFPATAPSMDEDIPQDVFDQIGRGEGEVQGSASLVDVRVCPHCTFENSHGGSDCEVCGLPLL